MDCDQTFVKNEPVFVDRPTRNSVKRQISKQQQNGIKSEPMKVQVEKEPSVDASKTSSKRAKLILNGIKSEPMEVQVELEQSADAVDESSTGSSYDCKICNKRFANLRSLKKHSRVHSDEESTKSAVEPKEEEVKSEPIDLEKYRIKQELIRELEEKEQEGIERRNRAMYTASIAFLRHEDDEPAELEAHVENPQPAEPVVQVEQTETQTRDNKSKNTKKTKQRQVNTGKKTYECKLCKKEFIHLKIHNRVHTGEKPYKCELCKKKFTQLSNLKVHNRVHTKEKPYKCELCKKTFTQLRSLKEHNRIHTGEKPYKCELCKKAFTQLHHLKDHNRIHKKEKPYKGEI